MSLPAKLRFNTVPVLRVTSALLARLASVRLRVPAKKEDHGLREAVICTACVL